MSVMYIVGGTLLVYLTAKMLLLEFIKLLTFIA